MKKEKKRLTLCGVPSVPHYKNCFISRKHFDFMSLVFEMKQQQLNIRMLQDEVCIQCM